METRKSIEEKFRMSLEIKKMKAVMLSVQPRFCAMYASGEKTLEIRKSRPKLETPFKVYIYCTLPPSSELFTHGGIREYANELIKLQSGEIVYDYGMRLLCDPENRPYSEDNFLCQKVIGEFMCEEASMLTKAHYGYIEECACVSREELKKYMGLSDNQELDYSHGLYGWHISDLLFYRSPRQLSKFYKGDTLPLDDFLYSVYDGSRSYEEYLFTQVLRRPPQSWCYVNRIS